MISDLLTSVTEIWSSLKIPIIFIFLFYVILSFFWVPIFNRFQLKEYNNIQKIHKNEVSRLGGFLAYLFLIICIWCWVDNDILSLILISSIPFVVASLSEDLLHNTSPKIRLVSMIISCFIFFNIAHIEFPPIDFLFLSYFSFSNYFNFIFFTFALIVLMNGMNLIDGLNGLFGFTAIFQLMTLIILSFIVEDFEMVNIILICLIPLIIFMLFNFPFGKIFAGDLGAYLYGFIIGILTINFFGKHDYLFSWLAVLILFYPCFELLFSYIRKVSTNLSPFDADDKHLHTLIYKYINYKFKLKQSNSLVTSLLSIFWLTPFFYTYLIVDSLEGIILLIFILTIIYICLYKLIIKLRNSL